MTITPAPVVKIATLLEWYVGHDYGNPAHAWILDDVYYTDMTEEPDEVEVDGVSYTEEDDFDHCKSNPSTWFWVTVDSHLYIHIAGASHDPAGHTIISYKWELYATHSPIVFGAGAFAGKYWEPRIKEGSIPEINFVTSGYHKGGTNQGFGAIKLMNGDGYFDSRLSAYVYEAKLMRVLVGHITVTAGVIAATYANFDCVWSGWSGDISWTDDEIEVQTEDLRRIRL